MAFNIVAILCILQQALNPFGFMSKKIFSKKWLQDAYFKTLIKVQRKVRQPSGNIASKRDGLVGTAWHEHSSNLRMVFLIMSAFQRMVAILCSLTALLDWQRSKHAIIQQVPFQSSNLEGQKKYQTLTSAYFLLLLSLPTLLIGIFVGTTCSVFLTPRSKTQYSIVVSCCVLGGDTQVNRSHVKFVKF